MKIIATRTKCGPKSGPILSVSSAVRERSRRSNAVVVQAMPS
jgi:hypothetical protein